MNIKIAKQIPGPQQDCLVKSASHHDEHDENLDVEVVATGIKRGSPARKANGIGDGMFILFSSFATQENRRIAKKYSNFGSY